MIFCSLFSGSSGNSIFVSSGKTNVLIDAGLPGKSIEKALSKIDVDITKIDALFVTHEHIDHIKGVGVISRRYNIPVYANSLTWSAMSKTIGKIKEENIKIITNKCVPIKDMDIISYKTSHDAASPCGYVLESSHKKVCITTDLGYVTNDIEEILKDADVILLESNHDTEMLKFGPYPYTLKRRILSNVGHLSNDDCGNTIVKISNDKYKSVILGHLSKTNNYPDLAYQTVINILNENGVDLDKISLTVAKRDIPSNYIDF
jgi:phosphoribosyl 1,2-cyclic phosphodiesterase